MLEVEPTGQLAARLPEVTETAGEPYRFAAIWTILCLNTVS